MLLVPKYKALYKMRIYAKTTIIYVFTIQEIDESSRICKNFRYRCFKYFWIYKKNLKPN